MNFERRNGPVKGMTGGEHERDTFGALKLKKQFMAGEDGVEYLPYEDAIRYVKERTEQDPENPTGEFANDLRLELIDKIAENFKGNGKVAIYATNGTPIDRFHGVDAFVEYTEAGNKRVARATLDVTVNTAKGAEYKADIVFTAPPEPDADEYLAYVEEIAQQVMDVLGPQIDGMHTPQDQGTMRVFRRDRSGDDQGLTASAK